MFRAAIRDVKALYRQTREYSRLTDSPVDRLRTLLYQLFASQTLPNILLGGAITMTIQTLTGDIPTIQPTVAWSVYLLSVLNYVVAHEVHAAAKVASQRFEDDPRGIY